MPGIAQSERNCDAATGTERETVWIGDRKWEKDRDGWRGPYSTIWTHQDRVPAPELAFSAGQVTCLADVVIDGRATNKYEFAKQIADRVWVETIYTDGDSGIPLRFETRGRSDASSGLIAIYRHDPSSRIDPPTVDLDKRWAKSLQRLSQEAEKGDPVCRAEFFAAVERGRTAAFEFEIKGPFKSMPCCLTGTFVPSDAIQYRVTIFPGGPFGETIAAKGQAWTKKSSPPDSWVEAPGKQDFADKLIGTLFPPSEYVGQVKCLGKVSADGRDYDWYEYDVYRDSESARGFYSHRSMIVEKASGMPIRNTSVSKRHAPQWVETRRYDAALTIQAPQPPEPPPTPSLALRPADAWAQPTQRSPLALGPAGAYWPPSGPNWPPFILTPPADVDWPSPPFTPTPPGDIHWPPRQ